MVCKVSERPMESTSYSGRLKNPREIRGASTGSHCTKIKCTPHRADFQTRGAVDWYAGEVRGSGKWALDPSRCRAGSRGARHRFGSDHAGRRMEVGADAAAICREDQCGEVGNGEGGGKSRKGFDRR